MENVKDMVPLAAVGAENDENPTRGFRVHIFREIYMNYKLY
jgi:hypothetical protein